MIRILKKTDRILLELHTGIIFWGLFCQVFFLFAGDNRIRYAQSLWFGIAMAVISSIHMAKTLDRALAAGAGTSKILVTGYVLRYVIVAVFFIVISLTQLLNPLVMFLGYMSLKVTAYFQPITHKMYNKLFHEADPVFEAMPEETFAQEEGFREDSQRPDKV